ncbi:hypothetical protein EDC01DRAFT_783438 [Geopyxis carbonaria]|nr:hypothetical protein EDC01DRAFT_783438 [Geopyxis carbonaria]
MDPPAPPNNPTSERRGRARSHNVNLNDPHARDRHIALMRTIVGPGFTLPDSAYDRSVPAVTGVGPEHVGALVQGTDAMSIDSCGDDVDVSNQGSADVDELSGAVGTLELGNLAMQRRSQRQVRRQRSQVVRQNAHQRGSTGDHQSQAVHHFDQPPPIVAPRPCRSGQETSTVPEPFQRPKAPLQHYDGPSNFPSYRRGTMAQSPTPNPQNGHSNSADTMDREPLGVPGSSGYLHPSEIAFRTRRSADHLRAIMRRTRQRLRNMDGPVSGINPGSGRNDGNGGSNGNLDGYESGSGSRH